MVQLSSYHTVCHCLCGFSHKAADLTLHLHLSSRQGPPWMAGEGVQKGQGAPYSWNAPPIFPRAITPSSRLQMQRAPELGRGTVSKP